MDKCVNRKHLEIGVAVVWDGGKVLIDQRRHKDTFGGYWEFPGGKIEEGEDAIACIKREIKEEIGISIEVGNHLITVDYEYGERFSVTLIVHHCYYVSGTPQPLESVELRWVQPTELNQFRFPAANAQILTAILANVVSG